MSVEAIAALIHHGEHVGVSDFTGADYPNLSGRNTRFTPPDETPNRIAAQILDFLGHEVKKGRQPPELPPVRSGVVNITNAALSG
ncbi:hypothetical protein [Aquabacterium sp. A08]|uniref:hypothetical protein n=1 Tax=Aquabacterium sp. A08 TaxID=2718532 RepID=UPI00141E6416|nr:hypothetical protein [Aquabacterium sp. A08]NIC43710.1 hypothetical protein [Aquabacterium sp. A08]